MAITNRKIVVAAIFIFALILRLAFLYSIGDQEPFLYGDAYNYDGSAIGIIEMCKNAWPNLGFIIDEALKGTLGRGQNVLHRLGIHFSVTVFNQGPVYPFFVASVYAIFGHKIHVLQFSQALIDALSCVLLFFAAAKAFSDDRAGFLAAFLWAIYLPGIYFTELVLSETLGAFVLILALLFLMRVDNKSDPKIFLASGIMIAVLMLTRHAYRFLWIFIPVGFCFTLIGMNKNDLVKKIALFLCGVGLLIGPWMAFTVFATGKASGLPSNKNYWQELCVKNNVKYSGWPPDSMVGIKITEDKTDYRAMFFKNLQVNPLRMTGLWLEKVERVWDRAANMRNRIYLVSDEGFLPIHRLLVCLGLFGMLLALRRHMGKTAGLVVIVIYVTLISSILHVESRYSFLAMPVVVMFAAYFIISFSGLKHKLAISAAVLLVFLGFSLINEKFKSETRIYLDADKGVEKIIKLPSGHGMSGIKSVNLLIDMVKLRDVDLKIEINGDAFFYSSVEKTDRFNRSIYDDVFKLKSIDPQEIRKWHVISVNKSFLKSGIFDVKISPISESMKYPVIFAQRGKTGNTYTGPSFARSDGETSFVKFAYDADYRLPWSETLNNTGTENYQYSIASGEKNSIGETGIRLEVVGTDGTIRTY